VDQDLQLKAYNAIKTTLKNRKSICFTIAKELLDNFGCEKEDLIHDVFLDFIEHKHKPLEDNIQKYIDRYCYYVLLDIKKHYSSLKEYACDRRQRHSYDTVMDEVVNNEDKSI
jgi:hypothetical protein